MSDKGESAREVIMQIWQRARINAFAHKEAMKENTVDDTKYYVRTILTSLGSILTVIILYVLSSGISNGHVASDESGHESWTMWLTVGFTLASISLTVLSLFYGIRSNHGRYGIKAAEHRFLMNSYQHIAQRARQVKWEHKPEAHVIALLEDLEQDFALLKARGAEPTDDNFMKAHEIIRKVKEDEDSKIAQSFQLPD